MASVTFFKPANFKENNPLNPNQARPDSSDDFSFSNYNEKPSPLSDSFEGITKELYMSLTNNNRESNMLILPPFNNNQDYRGAYNDMLINIGVIPANNENFRHPTNDTDGAIPSSMLSMLCNFNKLQYKTLINLLEIILRDNGETKYGHTKFFLANSDKICEFKGKEIIIEDVQDAGSKYRRKRTRKTRRGRKSISKKYKRTRRSYRRMHAKKNKNKKYSRK
jgi:hypothetical protein